ncbi:MAG: ACP S-malonyltransferase [Halobacteriovoraceae bacterium]|jgi:[acyl-carrier-protein] S-malonyltransferase|nr:ACP S-malonyltransferase [Halobacteriovoraceae bacterium]
MTKKTAVVICPGRGTYSKTELGYLHKFHQDKKEVIATIDHFRKQQSQTSVWDIDGREKFNLKEHIPGENSASLIYACSYCDFIDINQDEYEIVAITGNSMGWYIACACAGAVDPKNAINIINTMGSQMKNGLIGGQLVYPEVDENWNHSIELSQLIEKKLIEVNQLDQHEAYTSIYFGGLRVIGGNDLALRWLLKELPPVQDRFPFKLPGNAAFHTPLLEQTALKAQKELLPSLFQAPKIPIIDGQGKTWMPYSTNLTDLWKYTLGHQVHETYDFNKCIEVAIKEFAPDHLIITGPGMTLGGAVAQSLIKYNYKGLKSKNDFKNLQSDTPYVLAMGEPKQRELVL